MNIYKICFSPTGGTKKVLDVIGKPWGNDIIEIDLSDSTQDFSQFTFQNDDICLIAVPSFGGRVPAVALERLTCMKGGQALAIMIVTYGNRAYDDTLLELKSSLQASGFQCFATITAVTEHSIMHQFSTGRPDSQDIKELTDFSKTIKNLAEQRISNGELNVPGNLPYREYNGVPLKPSTNKTCTKCGLCAKKCPVQAIPSMNPSALDKATCISCMRCISICPQHARYNQKPLLFIASQALKKECSIRKSNELFTYLE